MNQTQENTTADRRQFISRSLAVVAGVAAVGMLSPKSALAVTPALKIKNFPGSNQDFRMLNYALSLEALEADLYVQALQRLTDGGTNALGKKITGLKVSNTAPDVQYIRLFGKVEREHRDFLNAALGSESILKSVLKTAKFDFGMEKLDRRGVLELVYAAEALGVGAYLGAIRYLTVRSPYLQIAGAIQGTEARHTAVVADILNDLYNANLNVAPRRFSSSGIDQPIMPDTVLATVSPFIVL